MRQMGRSFLYDTDRERGYLPTRKLYIGTQETNLWGATTMSANKHMNGSDSSFAGDNSSTSVTYVTTRAPLLTERKSTEGTLTPTSANPPLSNDLLQGERFPVSCKLY